MKAGSLRGTACLRTTLPRSLVPEVINLGAAQDDPADVCGPQISSNAEYRKRDTSWLTAEPLGPSTYLREMLNYAKSSAAVLTRYCSGVMKLLEMCQAFQRISSTVYAVAAHGWRSKFLNRLNTNILCPCSFLQVCMFPLFCTSPSTSLRPPYTFPRYSLYLHTFP